MIFLVMADIETVDRAFTKREDAVLYVLQSFQNNKYLCSLSEEERQKYINELINEVPLNSFD